MRRIAVSAVQFAAECVSSLRWNHCPVCGGISVQFGAEYADILACLQFAARRTDIVRLAA